MPPVYENTNVAPQLCLLLPKMFPQLTQHGRRDRYLVNSLSYSNLISCPRDNPMESGPADRGNDQNYRKSKRRGLILDALVFELIKKPSCQLRSKSKLAFPIKMITCPPSYFLTLTSHRAWHIHTKHRNLSTLLL